MVDDLITDLVTFAISDLIVGEIITPLTYLFDDEVDFDFDDGAPFEFD